MKNGVKNVVRIVISLIYIFWGIFSPISAFNAILKLDIGAIATAAVGILTLLAGILGLIGIKKNKCRIFGIVILVCSIVAIVLALPAISLNSIITAVLSLLFIICL